jgi:hypothetical protein
MVCKKHRWSEEFNLSKANAEVFPIKVNRLYVRTCRRCHLIQRKLPRGYASINSTPWVDIVMPELKHIYRKAIMSKV